ncbi:predicted protein [Ostreococcus lucimarinus CCE9901]|uniref:Uncharacterized protein n=1 Tax=Ostreococcus lucimarinus (strain CCE9901) TaxID=436017 RepID=A4RYL1_OSTLU|nr:predicted protein [Ostreococcus lucimarinus CCE9901]ABO96476.1 predicted protein [Ostreococcus lucimarinus CCE9901]|eukprot:XP_001418183.1 predicted protein [Ostreococcus lucimarinus CCE9901]
MANEDGDVAAGSRPKRKASASLRARTSRGKQAPSSAHYVGYVQDDETPEMIMKKFEEMERIRQATKAQVGEDGDKENKEGATNGAGGDAVGTNGDEHEGLDEEQLKELFKNTSTFTVKEAVMDSNALFGDMRIANEDGMYFSDDEELQDEFWEALTGKKRRVSYGRVIQPYEPKSVREAKLKQVPDCVHMQTNIKKMEYESLGKDYLGVLMNPPWDIEDSPDRGDVTLEDIEAIPLEKLTPLGFIFIWVEKENLSKVCDIMDRKNFVYVENLTWVQLKPNNTIVESSARYLGRSHRTMLIFRRDVRDKRFIEGKKIELRHQRNSDVTLDIVQTTKTGRRVVPEHVYKSIETLLPTAYEPGTPGKLLELWAEPGARRAGWTSVADTP